MLHKVGLTKPVYIGAWNGDEYKQSAIALYPAGRHERGAIAGTIQSLRLILIVVPINGAKGPYYGLCEKSEIKHIGGYATYAKEEPKHRKYDQEPYGQHKRDSYDHEPYGRREPVRYDEEY
jgi:hypothetical protein